MLLQTSSSSSSPLLQHLPLSYTKTPLGYNNPSTLSLRKHPKKNNLITCYIPHLYNHTKAERKPIPRWNVYFRRISLTPKPELGASLVLNQLVKEGKKLLKWELCRAIRELRKFQKSKLALEVYEWMNEQEGRYTLNSSDAAIHLDLIYKVHGVPAAEEYFSRLSGTFKDKRTYGSLLNIYAKSKMKEKAESLMEEMQHKGFVEDALPYNLMMTLYMKVRDYDKSVSMVSEMTEKNIPLDIYSYNIWLTACGAMGSTEKLEEVLEKMIFSPVAPEWTTYSTMATMYMNMGELRKARSSLGMLEGKITGRDRKPFQYLLSLYAGIGEKDEVLRIWNTYKASFPNMQNMGYHTMIAALLKLDDIEHAVKIYEEWLPVRSTYDPRICNLIMGWYVKNELLEKAEAFLGQALEVGGKVNAYTWAMLAEAHVQKRHIPEALSCVKQATLAEGGTYWKPKPSVFYSFLSLCEQESDIANKEEFMELMRQKGCLEDNQYMSKVYSNGEADFGLKISVDKDEFGSDNDNDSETDMLLNQLEGSL